MHIKNKDKKVLIYYEYAYNKKSVFSLKLILIHRYEKGREVLKKGREAFKKGREVFEKGREVFKAYLKKVRFYAGLRGVKFS